MKPLHVLIGACFLVIMISRVPAAETRVGLEESFDTMDGWRKIDFPREEAPLKEMRAVDGVGVFVTHPSPLASFKTRTDWHDGLEPHDPFSNIAKNWPELDLDTYHYLVMKTDEKGCRYSVIINHVDLPISYTTGIHAVDLSRYKDLRGKKAIEFRLQFINTGATIRVDWFRFVSRLTPEEEKTLIPAGLVLRPDELTHHPTQGLDAVMKRAHRPEKHAIPAERICFRDKATGAVIWRMTGLQRGSSVVSDSVRSIFNSNGSKMMILGRPGGPQLYDFQKDSFSTHWYAWVSRFSAKDPDILWCIEKTRNPRGIRFHRLNIRTGVDEIIGQIRFDKKYRSPVTDFAFSAETDRIAVGLRETPHVFILNPDKPIAPEGTTFEKGDYLKWRVTSFDLPMRLKGMGLFSDGKRLSWNRCYWYESWKMDLQTGEVKRSDGRFGGSHAGGGGGLRLGHYQGLILAAPAGMADPRPGNKIRIFLNYQSGWHTDYGHLASDRQWYMANGTGGLMQNQLIMANTQDPGAVLQIAFQNTSRNSWSNNTKIRSSPDYTKLAWVSDIWGYNAACMTYTRRPVPPLDLKATLKGETVELQWSPQRMGGTGRKPSETMGYNVYRSRDNGPFLALNRESITNTAYTDTDIDTRMSYRYVVAAQEYSGLEGTPSNEAMVAVAPGKGTIPAHHVQHLEAEHCVLGPPARHAFNGWTSSYRYVRIWKQLETETTGSLARDFQVQVAGEYVLWLRARAGEKAGAWSVSLDRQALGSVTVPAGGNWQWLRAEKPLDLAASKRHRLVLTGAENGLAIDKLIITNSREVKPKGLDDRFRVPPRKLKYLVVKEITESSVHLAWWNPRAESDLAYYNIYVDTSPDFPIDQAHLIGSTRKTEFLDWGLQPGREYVYKIAAINRRGLMAEPTVLTARTKPVPKRVLLELPIDRARLDKRLKVEDKNGVDYAFRPFAGKSHEKDPLADVSWEFELPVAGQYMIWCQYAPADYSSRLLRVPVQLDDFLGSKATWRMRTPYRSMRGPSYRLWKKDLWFVDKVTMYAWPKKHDIFRLGAGKHKLTLRLSPKMKEFHHKIGKIWITNDPSFRPPGWDQQADFRKAKLKRE